MESDPSRRRTPRRHTSPRKDQELADQQYSTTYTRLHGRKQLQLLPPTTLTTRSRAARNMQELLARGADDLEEKEQRMTKATLNMSIRDKNQAGDQHLREHQGVLITELDVGTGGLGSHADYGLHGEQTSTNPKNNDITYGSGSSSSSKINRSTTSYTPSVMSVHTSTEGLDQELFYDQALQPDTIISQPSRSYITKSDEAGSLISANKQTIGSGPAHQAPQFADDILAALPADADCNNTATGQYHINAERERPHNILQQTKSSGADHKLWPEDHDDDAGHRQHFVISRIRHHDDEDHDLRQQHHHHHRYDRSRRSAARSYGLTRHLKRSGSAIVSHVNARVVKKLKVVPGRIAARPRHVAFVFASSTLVTAVGLASYWYHLKELKEREKAHQLKRWWWW